MKSSILRSFARYLEESIDTAVPARSSQELNGPFSPNLTLAITYLTSRRFNENRFPSRVPGGGFVFSANFTLGKTLRSREPREKPEKEKRKLCVSRSNPLAYLPLVRIFSALGREWRACLSGITLAPFSVSVARGVQRFFDRYFKRKTRWSGGRPGLTFFFALNGPKEFEGTRNGFMRLHVSTRYEAVLLRLRILYDTRGERVESGIRIVYRRRR